MQLTTELPVSADRQGVRGSNSAFRPVSDKGLNPWAGFRESCHSEEFPEPRDLQISLSVKSLERRGRYRTFANQSLVLLSQFIEWHFSARIVIEIFMFLLKLRVETRVVHTFPVSASCCLQNLLN